jgi:hypothetical protein
MFTNQAAIPHPLSTPLLSCRHAPGAAQPDDCRYLRALDSLQRWIEQAREAHQRSRDERERIGELWRLQGEVSCAFDQCPNHTAPEDARVQSYAESRVAM